MPFSTQPDHSAVSFVNGQPGDGKRKGVDFPAVGAGPEFTSASQHCKQRAAPHNTQTHGIEANCDEFSNARRKEGYSSFHFSRAFPVCGVLLPLPLTFVSCDTSKSSNKT